MAVEESLKTSILGFKGETPATYTVENFSPEVPTTQISNKATRVGVYKPPSRAFEFKIRTTNPGTSANNQFTIPITSSTPYNIQTSDGQFIEGATGATTLTFPSPGIYIIKITESCEGWRFNNGGDRLKLLEIKNWGVFRSTVDGAFSGASNMTCSAVDAPVYPQSILTNCFRGCTNFNGAIGNWDVSNITSFDRTFSLARSFNADITSWDVSNVTNFSYMFEQASSFNQPIGSWATTSATLMSSMFDGVNGNMQFNQDISSWDVSGVTSFNNMFRNCRSLNQPFNSWNMSNAESIAQMFFRCEAFNQPLNSWDTSNVTNMTYTFYHTDSFNQPLNFWDTSKVTNMSGMFNRALIFDFPIGMWDVSSLVNIAGMFEQTAFNQDISNWNILKLNGNFSSLFLYAPFGLDETNYDELLVSWYAQLEAAYPGGVGYPNTVTIGFGNSKYSLGGDAEAARTSLINNFGWTITDGGGVSNPFIFTVKTNNAGVSGTDQFQMPLDASSTVNATVDWGDGTINTVTAYNDSNATHTYATAGTYTISVTGILNGWRFNNGGDRRKLLDISQWGIFDLDKPNAFHGAENLTGTWTDHPRIGNGDVSKMFANCFSFTGDLSKFSTTGVTNLSNSCQLWYSGTVPAVSNWDVSLCTSLATMFRETHVGGLDLSSWDVRNATNLIYMFYGAKSGLPDLSMWRVAANVTNRNFTFSVANMLSGAGNYNYGLESWEVGKCNFDGGNFMTGAQLMPTERYDSTLISWSNNIGLGPQNFSGWNFATSKYTLGGAAEAARNNLVNNYGFTFIDGGGV